MHHTIILSIPFVCGVIAGTMIGIGTAGLFLHGKIAAAQKSTWAEAMKFYATKQREQEDAAR